MDIDNTKKIRYVSGMKYQLVEPVLINTGIIPDTPGRILHLGISESGLLNIDAGYSWDGPSGPTFDTHTFMRGALIHDALYQLMRHKLIDIKHRKAIDDLLIVHCKEDGMSKVRRGWVYAAIRTFGKNSAKAKNKMKIIVSPK